MTALRCYTKHGLRAHYLFVECNSEGEGCIGTTFCGKDAYPIGARSRFFRRRLAQASMCARCERGEEAISG